MNKTIKIISGIVLFLILCFVAGSFGIMFLVNSGLTNEGSGKGTTIELNSKKDKELKDLLLNEGKGTEELKPKGNFSGFEGFDNKKDYEEQIAKYSIKDIDSKWMGKDINELIEIKKMKGYGDVKLENIVEIKDEKVRDVYHCLKVGLTEVDSLFNSTYMDLSDIYQVSTHMGYLIPSFNVYKNYCMQDSYGAIKNKGKIIKPGKHKNRIITDLNSGPFTNFIKDFLNQPHSRKTLNGVSNKLDIDKKLIMSIVLVEQLRAAETNRGYVKQLAKQNLLNAFTRFSLGIAGMKEFTAEMIENQLKDKSSNFYLGKKYEYLLDYKVGEDKWSKRRERLMDSKNYYWQYLYTGLMVKMFQQHWDQNGFNIDDKAGVLGTLYNLGFHLSYPKEFPSLGGSYITYMGDQYLFGELVEKNFIFLLVDFEKQK